MQEFYHTEQPQQPRRRKTFPPAKPGHKYCNTCFIEKPHDAYQRDNAQKDGYKGRCKDCYNARWNALSEEEKDQERKRDRESRLPRIEQRREYDRKRHNTDEHRAKRRENNARKREVRKSAPQPIPINAKQVSLFKICPQCDPPVEKFLSEFAIDPNRKDGHAGWCRECTNRHGRSEEAKSRDREYRKARRRNPELNKARREQHNKWRREHPESQQEFTMRRNARKKEATIERVSYKRILERDGYHCYICNKAIDPSARPRSQESLTFDHVIPIQPRAGEPQGTHCAENIKPAHKVCNARKTNKPLDALTDFDRQGPD